MGNEIIKTFTVRDHYSKTTIITQEVKIFHDKRKLREIKLRLLF